MKIRGNFSWILFIIRNANKFIINNKPVDGKKSAAVENAAFGPWSHELALAGNDLSQLKKDCTNF